jgi:hypothetical protein
MVQQPNGPVDNALAFVAFLVFLAAFDFLASSAFFAVLDFFAALDFLAFFIVTAPRLSRPVGLDTELNWLPALIAMTAEKNLRKKYNLLRLYHYEPSQRGCALCQKVEPSKRR